MKMEAAFGGTVFIEFIAYPAKTNNNGPGLAYARPEPFCFGIILTLRLLSSRALSFRMIIYKLIENVVKIKAEA